MINKTLISMVLVMAAGCTSTTDDSYFSGLGKSIANGEFDEERLLVDLPKKSSTSYLSEAQLGGATHIEINKDSVGSAVYGSMVAVVAAGNIAKELNVHHRKDVSVNCNDGGSMHLFSNRGLKHARFNNCINGDLKINGILSFDNIGGLNNKYAISMDLTFGDLLYGGVRAVSDDSFISYGSNMSRAITFNGAVSIKDPVNAFNSDGMLLVKTTSPAQMSETGRMTDGIFLASDNQLLLTEGMAWIAKASAEKTDITSPSGEEFEFDMSDKVF